MHVYMVGTCVCTHACTYVPRCATSSYLSTLVLYVGTTRRHTYVRTVTFLWSCGVHHSHGVGHTCAPAQGNHECVPTCYLKGKYTHHSHQGVPKSMYTTFTKVYTPLSLRCTQKYVHHSQHGVPKSMYTTLNMVDPKVCTPLSTRCTHKYVCTPLSTWCTHKYVHHSQHGVPTSTYVHHSQHGVPTSMYTTFTKVYSKNVYIVPLLFCTI